MVQDCSLQKIEFHLLPEGLNQREFPLRRAGLRWIIGESELRRQENLNEQSGSEARGSRLEARGKRPKSLSVLSLKIIIQMGSDFTLEDPRGFLIQKIKISIFFLHFFLSNCWVIILNGLRHAFF
jgi:hypothetical protein